MPHLPRPARPAASSVAAAGLALLLLAGLGGLAACTTMAKALPPNASVMLTSVSGGWVNGAGADLELRINYEFKALELQIDGVWITVSTAGAPGLYRYHWNPSAFTEGRFPMTARGVADWDTKLSNTVEVVLDRTPPQIVSRVPAVGGTGWPGEPVTVVLNERVKVVRTGTFSVTSAARGGAFPCVATLLEPVFPDHSTTGFRFVPSEPLSAPDELELKVTGMFADLAGNLLPDATWSVSLRSPWELVGGGAVAGAGVPPPAGRTPAPSLFQAAGVLHVATSAAPSTVASLAGGAWQPMAVADAAAEVTTDGTDLVTAAAPVRRWTGGAWQEITAALPRSAGAPPRKVLWAASGPASAWLETLPSAPALPTLCGAVWDGAAWVEPAAVTLAGASPRLLDLQVSGGALHALYFDSGAPTPTSSPGGLRVARLEATGWTVLPGVIPGITLDASLAGDLWIARVGEYSLETWRPTASGWALTGPGLSLTPPRALAPSLSVDAAGTHYLAYLVDTLTASTQFHFTAVHLLRGNGATWEEPWGVLNLDPRVQSGPPGLLIGAEGSPIVAWQEVVTGAGGVAVTETFVKRLPR